jgi:hypothetical protein
MLPGGGMASGDLHQLCDTPAGPTIRFSIPNASARRVKHGFNATRGCCDRSHRGTVMIRKFLVPALAIAMLGGCVTSGYEYRGGNGDYYYGQPQVEYRDYGSPYGGFGYGYPGGWNGSFGWGYGYGDPYGFYGGYYDPWRYYTPYRRPHHRDHHGDHHDHDDGDTGSSPPTSGDNDHRPPPWRDFVRVPPPGRRPPMVPQQPRDTGAPILRPMPRIDDRDDRREERREARREPERRDADRSFDRGSSDRTRAGSEPDRDLRRKREP